MFGSLVQMVRVVGFLLVMELVHTGSAAAAGSTRNTRQECEDQLENTSCLEVKDKGDCDSIGPQLCRKTCGLCPLPSSGCPEGFFNPSGPSSQCFKYYTTPEHNWTEAREFCIENGLTLGTPNDDVNLGELSTYLKDANPDNYVWLGARWSDSTSGFLWEAGVGEQPGSSSGRRELDESHPGWFPGNDQFPDGEPDGFVGKDWCLVMAPGFGSRPYASYPCSEKATTLCQL